MGFLLFFALLLEPPYWDGAKRASRLRDVHSNGCLPPRRSFMLTREPTSVYISTLGEKNVHGQSDGWPTFSDQPSEYSGSFDAFNDSLTHLPSSRSLHGITRSITQKRGFVPTTGRPIAPPG